MVKVIDFKLYTFNDSYTIHFSVKVHVMVTVKQCQKTPHDRVGSHAPRDPFPLDPPDRHWIYIAAHMTKNDFYLREKTLHEAGIITHEIHAVTQRAVHN